MYTKNNIIKSINESITVKKNLIDQNMQIEKCIKLISKCFINGNKVFICGNGGSAADAQHLSAEFLVRLNSNINRKPFPLISLALDTSTLTACSNDYDFKFIFSRNLEAIGNKNDLLIIISTSGNSKNILEVSKTAIKNKIKIIGFLGKSGGKVKSLVDYPIFVKSTSTARIQETHILLGHIILDNVEKNLIKKK